MEDKRKTEHLTVKDRKRKHKRGKERKRQSRTSADVNGRKRGNRYAG